MVVSVPAGDHRADLEGRFKTALVKASDSALVWEPPLAGLLDGVLAAVDQWLAADAERQTLAEAQRARLRQFIGEAKKGDPSTAARTWATSNLPYFIYFENYGQLRTRIHLPAYITSAAKADAATRTQMALFERSSLNPQEILQLGQPKQGNETDEQVQRRKDERSVLLESASFALTGDWLNWWTAGKTHQLHFDADGDDLVLRVSDSHNPFQIPFEERSHGFQWFFSFYLVFLVESAKAHKNAILLLDEPGLHLHPTLQTRLIEFFEKVAGDNQLIYSTHLPFLIDGNRLDRVRTVYLSGAGPQKTVVSEDVRPAGDRDTLFPLQAALGYSIAQTLFIGAHTVIVEGLTDYWMIKALSEVLALKGRSLNDGIVLVPAGGTSRLLPLASIMFASFSGDEKRLLVLLDSDPAGISAKDRVKDIFGSDARITMIGDAIGLPKATIEDLLPREEYVKAVQTATGRAFTLNSAEQTESLNVVAVERAFGRNGWTFGQSEKAVTALRLVQWWAQDPTSVAAETQEKGLKLIDAINAKF